MTDVKTVQFCNECNKYVTGNELEHCKSLNHPVFSAKTRLEEELQKNWEVLKRTSGSTIQQKESAKHEIDKLNELFGRPKVDWKEHDEQTKNISDKIYDLLESGIVFTGKDQNDIWVKIQWEKLIVPVNLNSPKAREILMERWYKLTKQVVSKTPYQDAIEHMIAKIKFECKNIHTYQRICHIDGKIYYDLGTDDHSVLRITRENHIVLDYGKEMPIFQRTKDIIPQRLEELHPKDDPLEELCDLFKIRDKQLFKVNLIHMLLPDQETPFMFFTSEYGSGKTSLAESIRSIIDPSSAVGSKIPDDVPDIQTMLGNRYLTIFDNVNKLNQDQSDCLCRALSGDAYDKRALYTDNELFSNYYSNKKIVFTGTAPSINYPDFISRTNFITSGINPDKDIPKSKNEVREIVYDLVPHILNQICKVLTKALSINKTITPKTRMADFEIFGEKISQALGYKEDSFLEAWKDKVENTRHGQIMNYPFVELLEEYLKNKPDVHMVTIQDLQTHLKTQNEMTEFVNIDKESWPWNKSHLTKNLNRFRGMIRKTGWEFEHISRYRKKMPEGYEGKSVMIFNRSMTQSVLG